MCCEEQAAARKDTRLDFGFLFAFLQRMLRNCCGEAANEEGKRKKLSGDWQRKQILHLY
jgi:hypothetical protein